MEQFVLVLASVYNKSLITQSITKQELPQYQHSQNLTYQFDSLKREIKKRNFSKPDCLVEKLLSCPRIKPSSSQTLLLDVVKTGFLLLDFAQQQRCKNADFTDVYFTSLDASGISATMILNQNAKAKERGSWVTLKIRTSEAAKAERTGWWCYASVRNLKKASNLSLSKVRHFLHSKISFTKFTLVTREFKQMKAFARFKIETWCMDLAYVDKLAKDNNGVKYLLVPPDMFDGTVDARGINTKDSKETFRAVLTKVTK